MAAERDAFNRLLNAASDLDAAMRAVEKVGAWPLIAEFMQQAEGRRHAKQAYAIRWGDLAEMLGLIRAVARRKAGVGRLPDLRAHVWVAIAAESWNELTGTAPSAAEGGAFWTDLEAFQSAGACLAVVPRLSRKAVAAGLKAWLGGTSGKGEPN